ncbi:DUF6583 family protein [Gracilibacillus thailandensis]|uniref:Uncharacterized protein n=1 Tax=Gracilibacillus thailandensis TaxID=563735 RepID=A0A6N7R263_9BACI|nr:DUF6583 family protein [Gracilibacillus thailandensis]MRI64846.1 hypothetical protein [Gracilibacillus thailandensis]
MQEAVQQEEVKQKKSKWIPIIAGIAIILIAGIVTVQAFLNTSVKEDYFLAEKNTIEQLQETFESRFEEELAWKDHTDEHAIESVYEITGQMNDPNMAGMGFDQMINNANITVEAALDKANKVSSTNISAGMAGVEISGLEAYIDNNDLYVGLPFLDNIIQLNGDDLGRILQEIDPVTFSGEENFDFSTLFNENPIPTEDIDYMKEEYAEYLYDELPEDAFEATSEEVTVGDNSVNADKISFSLSEEETKSLLKNVFDKMAEDEKLREIIIDQASYMSFAEMELAEDDIANFEEEFVTAMEEASANVDDLTLPDGFNSTIWVDDDIIVKRELSLAVEREGETATFNIDGTNEITDGDQVIDYKFTVSDGSSEETVNIHADFAENDGETNDTISLTAADVAFTIESNQSTQEEGSKNFEHSLSFEEQGLQMFTIHWLGEAQYEEDQMTVDHTFYAEDGYTLNQDALSIYVTEEGSTIDQVEIPSPEQVQNLSDMSGDEIIEYFETDVANQFQLWMGNIMGPGGF